MITKEAVYKEALQIKKNILSEKTSNYNRLLDTAHAENPRLDGIEREYASLGVELARCSMSGDKEKIQDIIKHSKALGVEKKAITDKLNIKEIVFDCPLCKDTGFVNGKICKCVKKIASGIMMSKLSSTMPLNDCRFDNFDLNYYTNSESGNCRTRMTAIFKLCNEYVEKFDPKKSPNLLFMGQAGLGKTHLTLAIVSGVIEKGFIPVYGPAEDLFSQIEKEKFGGENQGTYQTIVNSDLLVIDDLGSEMITSFTKSALYNLINSRLLSKKPTIINTNMSMREIEAKYTARISSRLIGEFEAEKFLGNDIRQQKALKR